MVVEIRLSDGKRIHTVCYKGKGSEVGGKKEGGVLGGVCARCRGGDYGEIKCC